MLQSWGHKELGLWQKFYYSERGLEKASDIDIRSGAESAPSLVLTKDLYILSTGF